MLLWLWSPCVVIGVVGVVAPVGRVVLLLPSFACLVMFSRPLFLCVIVFVVVAVVAVAVVVAVVVVVVVSVVFVAEAHRRPDRASSLQLRYVWPPSLWLLLVPGVLCLAFACIGRCVAVVVIVVVVVVVVFVVGVVCCWCGCC